MYQLILLIPQGIDETRFHDLWPAFLHHAEQMPGLVRESINDIQSSLYGPSHISRIVTFTFPDRETLQSALSSPHGEKAGDLIHQCTDGQVTILVADHRREDMEHLRQFQQDTPDSHE